MTTTTFKSRPLRSVGGRAVQIPFDFVPEFKPQELSVEFSLLVNDEQTGKKHRIHAYSGSVQVIEPPKNWFDLQLLSVYVIGAALVAGIAYLVYASYFGAEEKSATGAKKFEKPAVVQQSGVQDEWIPEHHLRARKGGKGKAAGALSSGDDEPSTPKRKGKGRK